MRKWTVLLLLAVSAWPAMAAKSVNVGQVEDLLDKLHGKSDGKVAQELSDLELTERVSPALLAHWEKDFQGSRSHEALIKLADLAAFLNPPAGDVVPIPGPDSATQERMLAIVTPDGEVYSDDVGMVAGELKQSISAYRLDEASPGSRPRPRPMNC